MIASTLERINRPSTSALSVAGGKDLLLLFAARSRQEDWFSTGPIITINIAAVVVRSAAKMIMIYGRSIMHHMLLTVDRHHHKLSHHLAMASGFFSDELFLILARLFWNQILICASFSPSSALSVCRRFSVR
uniref:Uncharacterized protein n=1 Tax=Anopheles farauti TaxID=69004 RepID=A0A182QDC0_9DIPT